MAKWVIWGTKTVICLKWQMGQDRAKDTIDCLYKVICEVSIDDTMYDLE